MLKNSKKGVLFPKRLGKCSILMDIAAKLTATLLYNHLAIPPAHKLDSFKGAGLERCDRMNCIDRVKRAKKLANT